MFGRENRKDIQRLRGIISQPKKVSSNKRVTSVLAPSSDWQQIKDTQSRYINHQTLFVAFEGNKSTCCLHVSSPKRKSRASIILFRGRVLSCVYGQRNLDYYTFGEEAYQSIKLDLTHPDSEFAVQAMTEEMALAGASVFEGQSKTQAEREDLVSFLESTMSVILKSRQPGCVQMKEPNGNIKFIVYFFDGNILGFFSAKDGWIKATFDNVLKKASRATTVQAQAFMLQTKTISALYDQTFGLTGVTLAESDKRIWISSTEAVDPLKLFEIHAQPAALKNTFKFKNLSLEEQRQLANETMAGNRKATSFKHAHAIDPWQL